MKIWIADDTDSDREELCGVLRVWSEQNGSLCDISEFKNGGEVTDKCKCSAPQLVFMDIYMDGTNGIDAARALRKISRSCLIVFLTSSREHTWDAFPLHPFDYVVKPWKQETIFNLMDEAALCLNEDITVEFTSGRQKLRIHVSNIGYISADNHHITIATQQGEKIKSYAPFGKISKQLENDSRFLLCNRGVVVNMDFIDKCEENSFLMKNGDSIPIRLKDIGVLRNVYAEYTFKNARRWG